MAFVLGIDASTTATKAVLVDEAGAVAGDRGGRVRVRAAAPAVERAGPAPVVGRRRDGDPAGARRRPGRTRRDVAAVGLTGQMHGLVLLDAAGEVLRPAILWNDQRTEAECDAIRAAVGARRLVEITGNDALTGFTAPKLAWVRAHEPEVWARVAHVLLPKDYVRLALTGEYAMDKADGAGTQLFDLAARDWSPVMLEALGIDPAWMPPTFEGPEVTGVGLARRPRRRRACEPARRSWRAAATRRPTPWAWGRWSRGGWRCRWGRRAWSSRRPTRRCSSPRGGSTRSATPCRGGGTSCR